MRITKDIKEIRTLISWAKKYLDCDEKIETVIESYKIKIENFYTEKEIIMKIVIDGFEVERYAYDNFYATGWKKRGLLD